MKKIFLFLAVASTAVFTSCSSDDNSDGGGAVAATTIVLASNVTAIEVGQSATFTVTDNLNNIVTGSSTLMANDVALTSATFEPTTAGTFEVKATYKNSKNVILTSNPITIVVTEPVVSNGKFTYGSTDYTLDNMFFRVHGNAQGQIIVVNWADEGQPAENVSLWVGVAYDGEDVATAPNYFQYYFTLPVTETAEGFSVVFPGEAEASNVEVYAEANTDVLDTEAVTSATASFTSFILGETANDVSTSENASSFLNGSAPVISHYYNGNLESVATANLLSSSKGKGIKSLSKSSIKNLLSKNMTMMEIKNANKMVKK